MALKTALCVFLIALMVGGLAFGYFGDVKAQSTTPTPSLPTFNLTFTDHSYDMPAATIQDGYTGPRYVPAHHDRNGTIDITITNQPFTQYIDDNNHTIALYYHYRCKGHYDSTWIVSPDSDIYLEASNSQETVFPYWINEEWVGDHSGRVPNLPADGKLDFQVEALIGYSQTICTSIARRVDDYHTYWVGETSGWSNTLSISIPTGEVFVSTPNPTNSPFSTVSTPPIIIPFTPQYPTVTPVQPVYGVSVWFNSDLIGIAIVALLAAIVVLLVFVVVFLRRRSVG